MRIGGLVCRIRSNELSWLDTFLMLVTNILGDLWLSKYWFIYVSLNNECIEGPCRTMYLVTSNNHYGSR